MIWYSNNFIRYIYAWKLQFLTKAILFKKKEEKVDFPQTNFGCPVSAFWLTCSRIPDVHDTTRIYMSILYTFYLICSLPGYWFVLLWFWYRWRNYLLQYKKYIECSKYFSCAKLKYKMHVIHSGHPKIKVNYLPCDKLAWYEHFNST